MKFLIIALFAASFAGAADVQVYLAAGQSNASKTWSDSIQRTLRGIAGSDKVIVVRSTHSANAMWQWFNLGSPQQNYQDDLAAVRNAISRMEADGNTAKFRGIFWFQGESDALDPLMIHGYAERFKGMMARWKQDLDLPVLPPCSIAIMDANPAAAYDDPAVLGTTRGNVDALREVQMILARQLDNVSGDSRGLARYDQWHLTESASAILGERMARAFADANLVKELPSLSSASLEIGSVNLVEAGEEGRLIEFHWESRQGGRYQVERSEIPGEAWAPVGPEHAGNGSKLFFRDKVMAGRMFYRVVDVGSFPPIARVATFGDSITANGSLMISQDGTNYWPGCWPAHLRTLLGHKIRYEQSPVTGCYTFAVNSAETRFFVPGGKDRHHWEALLASEADTLMMMMGANDVADLATDMAASASNIIGLWDEALAVGKQVIGIEVVSCRKDHPSGAQFPARQDWLNATLKEAAVSRGIEFIECADSLDEDRDGFSDDKFLHDIIHPNLAGGMVLAHHIAPWLADRIKMNPASEIPGPGHPAWITDSAFPSGPGPNANGWTVQVSGNARVESRLVAREDGVPGFWQEIDVSGMTSEGVMKSQPSDFIQVYASNFATVCEPGDQLVMVAEIETDNPFLSVWGEMHVGGLRTADHHHGGNLAVPGATPPPFKGLLMTEPWAYSGGAVSLAMVKACGNGRLRIGRLGIFRVER